MSKVAFSVMIGMEDKGIYSTFPVAFKKFWDAIMAALEGGTSYQWLETANFLVMFTEDGQRLPLPFYESRDLAYEIGLLEPVEDGKPSILEQPTMDNWEVYVAERYQRVPEEMLMGMEMDLLEHVEQLLGSLDELEGQEVDDDDQGVRHFLISMRSMATRIKEETETSLSTTQPEAPPAT